MVKRLLCYLYGTLNHCIALYHHTPFNLHGFSDADWVGNKDDFTSTSAYIIYLGHSPISWSSKKQCTVARSKGTKAEYRSIATTIAELQWISSLLTKLGVSLPAQPVIYCDNFDAMNLCANLAFHSCMKHVTLNYHFIRKQVQSGILQVAHVSFVDKLANALMKLPPR